jgi:hypothetical protein
MAQAVLILSTFKRLHLLSNTLLSIYEQTNSDFIIHVVHNNKNNEEQFKSIVKDFFELNKDFDSKRMSFSIHDNSLTFFHRHIVAKRFAKRGHKVIMFLDDDVTIPNNYVDLAISQWKPKTVLSSYALSYTSVPPDYKTRKKYNEYAPPNTIGYCGTGMSVIDASLYYNPDFFNKKVLTEYHLFDDIWMSSFATSIGWDLNYFDSKATLGGDDEYSTYEKIYKEKDLFIKMLFSDGLYIPIDRQ